MPVGLLPPEKTPSSEGHDVGAGDEQCQPRPGPCLPVTAYGHVCTEQIDKDWLAVNSLPLWGGCEHQPARVDRTSGVEVRSCCPWHQLWDRLRRGGSS